MKVVMRSSLSAMGSTSLPKSEIQPCLRARYPSQRSENAAIRKRIQARKRAVNVGVNSSTATIGAMMMRPTVMTFGSVLRSSSGMSAQRLQDQLADRLECVEHADTGNGDRLILRQTHRIQLTAQLIGRHGTGQIAFVPLQHDGQLRRIVAIISEVLVQVLERGNVRVHALGL